MDNENQPTENTNNVIPENISGNQLPSGKSPRNFQLATKIDQPTLAQLVTLFEKDKGRKPEGWGHAGKGISELVNWAIAKVIAGNNPSGVDNIEIYSQLNSAVSLKEQWEKKYFELSKENDSLKNQLAENDNKLSADEQNKSVLQQNIATLKKYALITDKHHPDYARHLVVLSFIDNRIAAHRGKSPIEIVTLLYKYVNDNLSPEDKKHHLIIDLPKPEKKA